MLPMIRLFHYEKELCNKGRKPHLLLNMEPGQATLMQEKDR
jgi:hypothetical protein